MERFEQAYIFYFVDPDSSAHGKLVANGYDIISASTPPAGRRSLRR